MIKKSKNKLNLQIIIPVYNEPKEILSLIDNLVNKLEINFNILIAYDFDNDRTIEFLNKSPHLNKINFVKNKSYGPNGAILTAIEEVEAEFFVVYMADDFHNIDLIEKMYNFNQSKNLIYDVIIPSRFIKGGRMENCPFPKNILVRLGNKFLSFILNDVTDSTNAFKFFNTISFRSIDIVSKKGFIFALEAIIKLKIKGSKFYEFPSYWIERKNGKSNFKIIKWLPYYFYWLIYVFFKIRNK